MAHDVFISYSTEDKPAADAVCAILEKNGVRCWIAPRDIMPGADWGESIVKGIRSSKVLLLVFSTNANKSKQIKREVEIAADGGVTIVPLRIENILPTEAFTYFLGNIHWLDALTPPLEKHLQEVAAKVKAILSTESVSSSEAAQPSSLAHAPIQQPARRNVLPVIGGIIAVLIVTSVLLFVWQWRTTASPSPVKSASINGTVAISSVSPVSAESIKSATSEPVPKTSTSTADKDAMILRILRAIETHDSGAFLTYTVDKQTDYFGHKNASNAFIQHDMEQDNRSYKWTRFVPDLSTFETSLGHETIEFHSDALDVQGKEHKARCRLDIYYAPTSPPRLQTVSLKVLG
jgi:TIR domain